MDVISTTNPAPPTGVTPTEVPLGITTTTSTSGGPLNKNNTSTKMFTLNEGLYYGTFTVSSTNAPNDIVFNWSSLYPLGDFENVYNNNTGSLNTEQYFVPWELIPAFYSRQCKIDWVVNFTPVKVADARVSFDISFKYDSDDPFPTDQVDFTKNDSVFKVLDSQDDSFSVVPPMYWLTNNVNTDTYPVSFVGSVNRNTMQPAFLPSTRMQIRIRNPYYPSMIQPDSFQVVVTVKPIVRQTLCIAGKSSIRTVRNLATNYTPRPYFLNRSTYTV